LERELERLAVRADVQRVTERLGYSDASDLYYDLGVGERSVFDVVAVLDELPAGQLDLLASGPSIVQDASRRGALTKRKFRLEIRGHDRAGLLHDITAVLLADHVSMGSMEATSDPAGNTACIAFDLETDGLPGLARIVDRVRQVAGIIEARRIG